MRKALLAAGIASLVILNGCGEDGDGRGTGLHDNANPSSMDSPTQYYEEDYRGRNHDSDDFGFTRVNNTTGEDQNGDHTPSIDREQLADIISRLSNQIPNVNDVSTLVTDEEVLIVYSTDSNNRNYTADQVKRTAMATVPRYYHVYVSDNMALRQNIENYATLDSRSRDIEYALDKTIKQMLKSPQGSKVSDEENANGESVGEHR
ncbi:YhcN/YlaJ family sporulation lipoprotein [Peribacillus glennii]|uniref:YhcN/YlaJ family sporulation lipoprotein n=1 Tax=Peribacillus glennii TaxID=2303991 RepID=UPI001F45A7A4|nr:YhcN/YlaJ family sporulation lipoprotein [Peribacillus glennii]